MEPHLVYQLDTKRKKINKITLSNSKMSVLNVWIKLWTIHVVW